MESANHIKNVKLTEEQILMLRLSDEDIKQGKLVPHAQVVKEDLKWLKEPSKKLKR